MFTLLSLVSASPGENRTVQVWASGNRFNTSTFFGWRGFNSSGQPIPNTSGVCVGLRSGELPYVLPTGGSFNYTCVDNHYQNLVNFWMCGKSGDGVYIVSET